MEFKKCEVGLFRLPGISIDAETTTDEHLDEIAAWSESTHGVGKRMTPTLWSFKSENQRDWFIIKWFDGS